MLVVEEENKNNTNGSEKREMVNHPSHYRPGVYEAINVIEAWGLNFNLGNSVKYISRCGLKSSANLSEKEKSIQDLKKATWYLNREVSRLEGKSNIYEKIDCLSAE